MIPATATAIVLLVASAALFAAVLSRLRRLELEHGAPGWWFGYVRDGVNLVGTGLFIGGFRVARYPLPTALMLGIVTSLALYVGDWAFGRWRPTRVGRAVLLGTITLAAAVAALPGPLLGAPLEALLDAVVPH